MLKIKKEAGFTLMELVVALFGSILLVLAILTVFNRNHRFAEIQDQVSEMQGSARFALNYLENSLSSAGYEFREEISSLGMDPRLAVLVYNNVSENPPDSFGGGSGSPFFIGGIGGLPPAKANSDAIATTTSFIYRSKLPNISPGSLCPSTVLTWNGTNYVACFPVQKCQILNDRLTQCGNDWWSTGGSSGCGASPSDRPLEGTPEEPVLMIQWDHPNTLHKTAAVTLSLENITKQNGLGICGGNDGIIFDHDNSAPQGLQILPQIAGGGYNTTPTTGFSGSPPATVKGSLVNGYLFYIDNENRMVRVRAGFPAPLINNVEFLAYDMEDFQIRYSNENGNQLDAIIDDWGETNPNDNLIDTEKIYTAYIALIMRTRLKEGTNSGNIQVSSPISIFDHSPPPIQDAHRRRLLMRAVATRNLRF